MRTEKLTTYLSIAIENIKDETALQSSLDLATRNYSKPLNIQTIIRVAVRFIKLFGFGEYWNAIMKCKEKWKTEGDSKLAPKEGFESRVKGL